MWKTHVFALPVRTALAALAIAAMSACADDVTVKTVSLSETQARTELQDLGIVIPDTYSFLTASKIPPPGSGGSSYGAVFDSPSPPAPISLDGAALPMILTSCQELHIEYMPDGLRCALLSTLDRGSARLTMSADGVGVLAGTLPSGTSRIYISVSGH